MPKPKKIALRTDYVVEIAVEFQTAQQDKFGDEKALQLIDKQEFIRLFNFAKSTSHGKSPNIEPDLFWDILFGNNPTGRPQEENAEYRYLTNESFALVYQYHELFLHGFDFNNLPNGFYLAKNPLEQGARNVVHFSDYLSKNNKKVNPLAVVLSEKTPPESAKPDHGFVPPQSHWYEFLRSKMQANEVVYCTEEELKKAFIGFSNTVQRLGLQFEEVDFARLYGNQTLNPIILLGRWNAVLTQPHLKKEDVNAQWQVLPQLHLKDGYGAIRAISDYQRTITPCGFIVPEMFAGYPLQYAFINTVDHPKKIDNNQDFWRYIAFQPKRNSVAFYQAAMEAISEMDISQGKKIDLSQILAGSTTGRTHVANNKKEEEEELETWKGLCTLIDTVTDATETLKFYTKIMGGNKQLIKNDYIAHLHRLTEFPNIPILKSVAECITEHLQSLSIPGIIASMASGQHPLKELLELSDKINILTQRKGAKVYNGSKYYFVNNKWIELNIQKYTELQYDIYAQKPVFSQHFAPYLSTFGITKLNQVDEATSQLLLSFNQDEKDSLDYCLQFFDDSIKPRQTKDILELLKNVRLLTKKGKLLLPLLNYMADNFTDSFPKGYFDAKRKALIDAQHGLSEPQKQRVRDLKFPEAETQALISIESALLIKNNAISDAELDALNDCFVQFSRVFAEADFKVFLIRLETLRNNYPGTTKEMIDFLNLLIRSKTLEGFNQIYFRNKIEKCPDDTLLPKIQCYIESIKPKGKQLADISSICIQDLLATIVLNSSIHSIHAKTYDTFIDDLLKSIEFIGREHPHIASYLLDSFNYLDEKNTTAYVDHVTELSKTILGFSKLLKSGYDEEAKKDMLTLYTLMANFYKKPIELNTLWRDLSKLGSAEQQKFLLNMINAYVLQNKPLSGLQALVTLMQADPSVFGQMQKHCVHPPYQTMDKMVAWFNDKTFETNYPKFSMRPFGKRHLEYSFNANEFTRQKSKFIGVDKHLFTDAITKDLEKQLKENRKRTTTDIQKAFADLRSIGDKMTNDQKLTLLALCIEMLSRTSFQLDHKASDKFISQEVNTTQAMALYAMLMDPSSKKISEIDTGEGKSRIMMILAAANVAFGKTVDIMTSDMQLSERDFLSYQPFFQALDIRTGLISLNTPKQLYQSNGVNFSDNSQIPLLRNRSEIVQDPFAYLEKDETKRCLLIDEADKFIHDRSQDSYNYAAYDRELRDLTWVYPLLVNFVREIHQKHPNEPFEPQKHTKEFVDYVAMYELDTTRIDRIDDLLKKNESQLTTWLSSANTALHMKVNDDYKVTENEDKKLFAVRDMDGFIHYTRKVVVLDTGRLVEKSTFADGIHQCLCAIENQKAGNEEFIILPENVTQRSIYPVSFLHQYDKGSIYGATGTSRREAPTAEKDINYENYSYIRVPRQRALRREDKSVLLANGPEQHYQFLKKCMLKHLKRTPPGSILLIGKSDEQSKDLYERIANDRDVQALLKKATLVHALTEKHDEVKAIHDAGQSGHVTVSTAGMFSRGVDIHASDLLVLSAYVPTIEDEIQIKGRTGRFGKEGEYRMVPDLSDPDCPIKGTTYNVHKEVDKLQKRMALTNVELEEVSKLYAEFLENTHQAFLQGLAEKTDPVAQNEYLKQWQSHLGAMQKDWNLQKEPLLVAIEAGEQEQFIKIFNAFSDNWEAKAAGFITKMSAKPASMETKAKVIYKALDKQKGFFKPKAVPLKVQRGYDVADDGQARVYSTLFAQEIAIIKGERDLFADYKAYKEGRGELFPDLMATLRGERPLFANLRATIARLLEAITQLLSGRQKPEEDKPEEDDFGLGPDGSP